MNRTRAIESSASTSDALDVLVIGGGQAGLAMGNHLAQSGRRFQILDAAPEVGHEWRSRWDSLRLFTPAQYDNLPGMPFTAPPDTYPTKDEVASYLQTYATRLDLPLRLNTKVTSLTRSDNGYVVRAGDEAWAARQVVVATGPFQVPFVPPVASGLDPDMRQIHSSDYRNPEGLPLGKVLVIGGANSGSQIALELSETRDVELSVGQRLLSLPQRPLGRDLWWWLTRLGLDRVTVNSRLGRRMSQRDVVIGAGPRQLSRRHGVRTRPRVTGATGRTVTFADGSTAEYDAIVWATGFKTDHSWIDVPGVRDARGRLIHERGVTPSPGLYVLGLTWQHTRTSALLGWVANDSAYLAERIDAMSMSTEPMGSPARDGTSNAESRPAAARP